MSWQQDMTSQSSASPIVVPQFIKGETRLGVDRNFGAFATANVSLADLSWNRREPGPAFDIPVNEIVDLLVATGERLRHDPDGLLVEALNCLARTGDLPRDVLERDFATLPARFQPEKLAFQINEELGGNDVLDGWRKRVRPDGRSAWVRAFPPRLIHILAGNAPGVATTSIIRGALTKGLNLLKLPSNDLFTATAVLRAMAAVAPGHPVTSSFSAAYWKGGNETLESSLFRAQYYDKLVAWGGEATIRSATKYVGPGFELVSFDPKNSMSLIGSEAFRSESTLAEAAAAAATDATVYNQDACVASRFQFVEGSEAEVDRFCAALQRELGMERSTASAVCAPVGEDLREEIEGLRELEPMYRVWGRADGRGIVVRSHEPVDFYPVGKTVNVVRVGRLTDAVSHATVATQTVGIFPESRKTELRDALCAAGVQRVVNLGNALGAYLGLPHDGFLPLSRFVRWVVDED
jgi:hypothetical protein